MREALARLAFAIALALGAPAKAAPVDIYVTPVYYSGNPNYAYEISAAPSLDLGNISLYVVGFSGRTLEPLPQISVLDSPFVGGPPGASVQITSQVGQNLVPQTGGPSDRTVLATLIIASFADLEIRSGDDTFGFTAVNRALTEPIHYRLWVDYDLHGYELVDSWLPEPTTPALLGLGIAALALVRRRSQQE